jgi:aldose 1-epimerase
MSARSDPILLSGVFDGRTVEAVVSPVGASLQALTVDGVALVCGSPEGPVASSGAVLLPWPNRVRGGRWMLDGRPQQLELTEPHAGNALHGLVATTAFAVAVGETDAVALTTAVRRPPGYPFDLEVLVSYRLTPSGVDSTIQITNRGDQSAPVAVGVHPYLRVGDAAPDDLLLHLDAGRTLLLGDDNLPLVEVPVAETAYDLRSPTPLRAAPTHAAYTGLRTSDGRIALRVTDRATERTAEVWADARFRWAQLYVTGEVPGLAAGRLAVALEPMTAPPDALGSGTDLEWLSPHSPWELSWGIRLRTR